MKIPDNQKTLQKNGNSELFIMPMYLWWEQTGKQTGNRGRNNLRGFLYPAPCSLTYISGITTNKNI